MSHQRHLKQVIVPSPKPILGIRLNNEQEDEQTSEHDMSLELTLMELGSDPCSKEYIHLQKEKSIVCYLKSIGLKMKTDPQTKKHHYWSIKRWLGSEDNSEPQIERNASKNEMQQPNQVELSTKGNSLLKRRQDLSSSDGSPDLESLMLRKGKSYYSLASKELTDEDNLIKTSSQFELPKRKKVCLMIEQL